jgi:hypothetical protein
VLHAPQERPIGSVKEVWDLATEPGYFHFQNANKVHSFQNPKDLFILIPILNRKKPVPIPKLSCLHKYDNWESRFPLIYLVWMMDDFGTS